MNCKHCNAYFLHIGSHERCCQNNPDRDLFLNKLKISSDIAAQKLSEKWNDKYKEICDIIKNKGGTIVSTEYQGYDKKIKFICDKGHPYETLRRSLIDGHWCKICGDKSLSLSIEDMQETAKERGGECLSKSYDKSDQKLLWKCFYGHIWEAKVSAIRIGHWCTVCSSGLYERICRTAFEQLFGEKFIKCRPKWLVNEKGFRLELDGYCEKLGIAFEHNGDQHYIKNNFFFDDVEKISKNDKVKVDLCEERGIKLIVLPQLFTRLKIQNLKEFIKNKCNELNIKTPNNWDSIIIDCKTSYINSFKQNKLNELKLLFNNFGFDVMDNVYAGVQSFLNYKCKKCNIEGKILVSRVLYSNTVPKCIRCDKKTLFVSDVLEKIKLNNGECLDDLGLTTNIVVKNKCLNCRCVVGHLFKIKSLKLMNGLWCLKCRKKPVPIRKGYRKIEDVISVIIKKENAAIIGPYPKLMNESVLWKCSSNHEFKLSVNLADKRQIFCVKCAPKKEISVKIEDYQKIAKNRGGECLSDYILSAKDKLEWKCAKGHIWEAKASAVKHGSWCKKCFFEKNAKDRSVKIEEYQEIAKGRGGKCLSKTVSSNRDKLEWKCKKGHVWFASGHDIKAGKWCKRCYQKSTLTDINQG